MINRKYHALTTKYNVLYNGKVAFEEGIKNIENQYEDDFWELLPIEPIKFTEIKSTTVEDLGFGGFDDPFSAEKKEEKEKEPTPFELAEEKSVKAIQKHSMKINGKEKNSQIDDAYLLLGKSRYYTQRFIPAIEAFNYVTTYYPQANLIGETKVWRAKANIRIGNEDFAIETLSLLLKDRNLSKKDKANAHTALAMAYTQKDSLQAVIEHLKEAVKVGQNKNQKARNLFILGQVYGLNNHKDSALYVFNKLANYKKAPYKYRIHANIAMASNTVGDSSASTLIEKYRELIEVRENRPYLASLYHQMGVLEEERDSLAKAVENYKIALTSKNVSEKQKEKTYEKLATLYFNSKQYVLASKYYDSVLATTQEKNLKIKRIERKVEGLTSLVSYESIVYYNDSVLELASLTPEERKVHFEKYIQKLKQEDARKAQKKLNEISFGNSFGRSLSSVEKGKWYFYNDQSLAFGKKEFQQIWGDRSLADNWRWSANLQVNQKKEEAITIEKTARYDLNAYLQSVPTDLQEIDSLKTQRNNTLFKLGILYKERFNDHVIAASRFERLLSLNPKEDLLLPANYHLFRIYNEQNNSKAQIYKNRLLEKYPESPYAQIIKNPNKKPKANKNEEEIEELYKIAFNLYRDRMYEDAVCFIEESLATIENSVLIPKFELLKAYCIGKYAKKTDYKESLRKVFTTYPNTVEGKKALEIANRLKK